MIWIILSIKLLKSAFVPPPLPIVVVVVVVVVVVTFCSLWLGSYKVNASHKLSPTPNRVSLAQQAACFTISVMWHLV